MDAPNGDLENAIVDHKVMSTPEKFLGPNTMILLPLLSYAYSLEYDEQPDYKRIKFYFQKILMDEDFYPDKKFDWSLRLGELP